MYLLFQSSHLKLHGHVLPDHLKNDWGISTVLRAKLLLFLLQFLSANSGLSFRSRKSTRNRKRLMQKGRNGISVNVML